MHVLNCPRGLPWYSTKRINLPENNLWTLVQLLKPKLLTLLLTSKSVVLNREFSQLRGNREIGMKYLGSDMNVLTYDIAKLTGSKWDTVVTENLDQF